MENIRGIIFQTSNVEQVTLHDGTPAFIVNEKTQLLQSFTDFNHAKKVIDYLITAVIMDEFDYYANIDIMIVNKDHEEKEYMRFSLNTLEDEYNIMEWREHWREYVAVGLKAGLKNLHSDVWSIIEDLKQYLI